MLNTSRRNYKLLVFTLILLVINIYLFHLDLQSSRKGFTFAMLDVGQGDALFIESPTGVQVLFDAGPAGKILSSLSKVMSPFDKTIDAIVITNPDADHISGFSDIIKNYKVGMVLEPGTVNDSKIYKNLKDNIDRKQIPDILAKQGMKLDLGGGVTIDILFPDRDVSSWGSNDGSIVAKVSYGDISVMLTGDATMKTEKIILEDFSKESLKSTVLKVGHHGSRTSSSDSFVRVVAPSFALISDGEENKYGHPHQEVLDTLSAFKAQVFRADILGTIVMQSDGQNVSFSYKK